MFLAITFHCNGQERIILTTGDSLFGWVKEVDSNHSRIIKSDGTSVLILSSMIKKEDALSVKIILTTGDSLMGRVSKVDSDHSRITKSDGTSILITSNMIVNLDDILLRVSEKQDKTKGFQKGYIVKREHADTIYGLVNMHGFRIIGSEWVDFKINYEARKKPYREDSIISFRYGDDVWMYFKYCGWSKRIIVGTIDVYKGTRLGSPFSTPFVGGAPPTPFAGGAPATPFAGSVPATPFAGGVPMIGGGGPCLAFKRGNDEAKFIGRDEAKLFNGAIGDLSTGMYGGILKQKTKDYFYDYIGDNPELCAEMEKENFRYEDLETLIIKFNAMAKNKKK